jgi:capsular exopolysaccharide synthesis family protein
MTTSSSVDATDPRDLLRLLRRRGWILLLCVIVIPAAVYVYSERLTKTYSSTVIVQPQATADPAQILSGNASAPQNTAGVASLAETASVRTTAERLQHVPIGSIAAVTATSDSDTGFVTLKVTGPTSLQAQRNARAVTEALGATRRKQSVKQISTALEGIQSQLARETDRTQRTLLRDQQQKLRTVQVAQNQNLGVVEPPLLGDLVAPHPARNALLALIAAILIGIGLMVLVERLDRKVRRPEELETIAGVPLLGTIPKEAFPGESSGPPVSEAFQTLRDSLTYFNIDRDLTTLVVVSPLKGEGKTTVVSHLAVAFARAGKRVIAVDTDMRHPQLASRFGLDNSPGLSEVLGSDTPESALRSVDGFDGLLQVMPGGKTAPNPSELLGSASMSSMLSRFSEVCDLVLIDTPPLLVISDAFALLQQGSGLVGVARVEQTRSDVVARMVDVISTADGRLLGMVATGSREPARYGYGYGYQDASGDGKGKDEAPVTSISGVSSNGVTPERQEEQPAGAPPSDAAPSDVSQDQLAVGATSRNGDQPIVADKPAARPALGRRVRRLFRD